MDGEILGESEGLKLWLGDTEGEMLRLMLGEKAR